MGLVRALAFFQHILQKGLKDHLRKPCFVYIDDIIIFGRNKVEHDKNFAAVMNLLRENGLKVSPSKLAFCQTSVKFLGHIISEKGIETDPEKVKCIQNWPKPLVMKELSRFIGFVNYYRKFVPNFSKIIFLLEAASNKAKNVRQIRVKWNDKREKLLLKVSRSFFVQPQFSIVLTIKRHSF